MELRKVLPNTNKFHNGLRWDQNFSYAHTNEAWVFISSMLKFHPLIPRLYSFYTKTITKSMQKTSNRIPYQYENNETKKIKAKSNQKRSPAINNNYVMIWSKWEEIWEIDELHKIFYATEVNTISDDTK